MRIYTDGSCSQTIGGWAWWNEVTEEYDTGVESPSTNQRMELYAALQAVLTHINIPSFTIVSDSAYLVNCFQQEWYAKWHRNNWMTRDQGPVKSRDIWEPLVDAVLDHGGIVFEWVRGHSGVHGNEMADQLASNSVRSHKGMKARRVR